MKWVDRSPVWEPQPVSRLDPTLALRLGRHLEPAARQADSLPVVAVAEAVLAAAMSHVRASPNEQGGLLIGETFALPEGQLLLHVSESVAAVDFESSAMSLRMGSRVWSQARERLLGGRLIIGWYHSHPDLGAFFSSTDRRTQSAFFAHDYSLGWVIDPIRGEQAWYLGRTARELPQEQFEWLGSPSRASDG